MLNRHVSVGVDRTTFRNPETPTPFVQITSYIKNRKFDYLMVMRQGAVDVWNESEHKNEFRGEIRPFFFLLVKAV